MPENSREHRNINCGSKYAESSIMISVASKKPKMKMKAAKVLKFLLNFLQIKSKRKPGDKERLCIPSCTSNSFSSQVDITQESHPLKQNLAETIPSSDQTEKGLSLSWSYLVHEPFVSDVRGYTCDEEIDNGGIFYNESYFEDDYWQDFREQDLPVATPVGFGNESHCRIFQPERTPCGEFKRNLPQTSHRRRHASLPNYILKGNIVSKILSTHGEENNSRKVSEWLDYTEDNFDYDKLMFNRSQFGLNIAFDNLLDETSVYNDKHCSNNRTQLLLSETNTNHLMDIAEDDTIFLRQYRELSLETFPCCPEACEGFDKYEQSTSTTEIFETISESSVQVVELCSEGHDSDKSETSDCIADPLYIPQIHSPRHEIGKGCPFIQQSDTSNTSEENSDLSRNLVPQRSSKCGSLESGYSSSDNSLPAAGPIIHDRTQDAQHSLNSEKPAGLNPHTETDNLDLKKLCAKSSMVVARPNNTALESQNGTLIKSARIQTSPILSTSSPVHFLDKTSDSRKVFSSIQNFLSPIGPNSETLRSRLRARNNVARARNNFASFKWNKPKQFKQNLEVGCLLAEVSVHSECNPISSSHARLSELLSEDYPLLARAANFIINRIWFKTELKPYINFSGLVQFLSSYYLTEISTMSNRMVQTVADYRKVIQESMDLFTSYKLTHDNCFNELLKAILATRPRNVAMCEEFVFENLHRLINRKEYMEAPPELIIQLVCNFHIPRPEQPYSKESESDIQRFVSSYLEAQQSNLEKYTRITSMISIVFDKTNLNKKVKIHRTAVRTFPDSVSEIPTKTMKLTRDENAKPISSCTNSGLFSVVLTDKNSSEVMLHGLNNGYHSSYFETEQKNKSWNRPGRTISTMV